MGKNVTIYDVAREAGVSLATVSRVINGSSVVKPKTRDKVLEAIQRLDFKPNQIARGLATSKTTTIAIVFPQSLFAHVKDMIGGIGDTSRRLDYNVSIYTTDEIGDGNPIEVVIGTSVTGKYMGSIFADAKKIAYEVVDKYLAQGKSDILFVSPKQNLINIEEMITGIQEAYQKYDLVFDATKQVVHTSSHYEKSYPQFLEYFKNHRHDLVFTSYDKEAVAVVNAAIDNGIEIPDEMEVIGMMNTSYALICRPSLTSIHVPVYDMGALAVRLLTKILNDEEIENKAVVIQHLLMPRATTKKDF